MTKKKKHVIDMAELEQLIPLRYKLIMSFTPMIILIINILTICYIAKFGNQDLWVTFGFSFALFMLSGSIMKGIEKAAETAGFEVALAKYYSKGKK